MEKDSEVSRHEGLKVITASEMVRIEKKSIQEGCSDAQYMQQAGKEIALYCKQYVHAKDLQPLATLLIGKGNNGGDAFAAGCYLLQWGFKVHAFSMFQQSEISPLQDFHRKCFQDEGGEVFHPQNINDIAFFREGIILDGLFGTGFGGEMPPFIKEVIRHANSSHIPILSIDVPSGIHGTKGLQDELAIDAAVTLFLCCPKIGMFLGEAYNYIGEVHGLDFGLPKQYLDEMVAMGVMLHTQEIAKRLPKLRRSRHKYQAGYGLILAGSEGMSGAAALCTESFLRSGAGIARIYPSSGTELIQLKAPVESIVRKWNSKEISEEMQRANALIIGPGLRDSESLFELLSETTLPVVLDADGLLSLKEHLADLHSPLVLTPHLGEFKKLVDPEEVEKGFLLEIAQDFAEEHDATLVLKGAPTWIFHPGKEPVLFAKGNPGMASAGSGDVLTGLIGGFLAQGLSPFDASLLGVELHATAGEITAKKTSSYTMIASDLLKFLDGAFDILETNRQTL